MKQSTPEQNAVNPPELPTRQRRDRAAHGGDSHPEPWSEAKGVDGASLAPSHNLQPPSHGSGGQGRARGATLHKRREATRGSGDGAGLTGATPGARCDGRGAGLLSSVSGRETVSAGPREARTPPRASSSGAVPFPGARRVAALYVERGGVYFGREGVDPWGEDRDARAYCGPDPVVGHPPCARWGRYWSGGPSHAGRFELGDDGGCFESCLCAVRKWSGVLEHPADSKAWGRFGLMAPPRSGGWVAAGDGVGWTCCVWQGHYGFPAPKATWLYAVRVELPSLRWGPCREVRGMLDRSGATLETRLRRAEEQRARGLVMLSARKRCLTPPAFADVLVAMARTGRGPL